MKTFRNVIMLAAALVLGFTSCNNDDVIIENNGETKTLSFSITQGATPRAETPSQGAEYVVFNGGTLFFTTSTGIIVKKYTIGDANADFLVTDATSTTGITITNVPGTATGATLVGNTDLTVLQNGVGEVGRQIQNVKAYAIGVAKQANINNVNIVNLFGESNTFNKVGNVYECTIDLNPTVARVELSDIKGNEDIASFTVEGIFIDEFYEKAQIGGAVIAGSFENFANGQPGDADKFRPGNDGKYEYYIALYDWYTTALVSATNIVRPTVDNTVWGYNLFANNSATPHIIIRLKDVYVNVRNAEGVITGTKLHPASEDDKPSFVTIRGFIGVNKTTGFESGYVYTVDANSWAFGPGHVTEEPDMNAIDVKVTVTVAKWIPKKVLPDL
jgi:hypothetical protein